MNNFKLIHNYKDIPEYRLSFNDLANSTFGIDFEKWYQNGFWNDRYVCYSYTYGRKVVANISINKMDVIIEGERKRALQLGTIMTHPEYTKRGLAKGLMNIVLEEYEKKYDFTYLFANESVLNFYPKFGFKSSKERQFSIDLNISKAKVGKLRKLDVSNTQDLRLISNFASERIPVSDIFGTENSEHILMWYCLNIFHNDIYYLEEEDVVVIYKTEKNKLHLYDVISKGDVYLNRIINTISSNKIKKVVFYFTPDSKSINGTLDVFESGEMIFIKPNSLNVNIDFKYPITSQA